jgi:fructan beta-fructosidase
MPSPLTRRRRRSSRRPIRSLTLALAGLGSAGGWAVPPTPATAATPPATVPAAVRPDVLFADFEADTYGDWTTTGTAFGPGPAAGTLPGQMAVGGFKGKRLVNSFHGHDRSTGTLTSPAFTVDRKYVAFLVGGGGFAGKTCVDLLVDGNVVRTATGPNTEPGGSEDLEPGGWDVAEFAGKQARIRVVDEATGGWGHVNLDHVVFTDVKPPAAGAIVKDPSIAVSADRRYLYLPVKNGAKVRTVTVSAGGKAGGEAEVLRTFTIEAADGEPDWWASLDLSVLSATSAVPEPADWRGRALTVSADRLPEGSRFLSSLVTGDAPRHKADDLYREPLRPQFHFSPARGWTNDPNGLVFYGGEYHLFFQHNPYGTKWGNMHWGHAVSKDLVRWREVGEALYPDALGTMYSGSAVVDWRNTSGLGNAPARDEKGQPNDPSRPAPPPLVLAYTADKSDVQCIAGSADGRTFAKFVGNPVVRKIGSGDRDPKVFWHEPTKRWVMVLYVGLPRPADPKAGERQPAAAGAAAAKEPNRRDVIKFFTSPDLKDWTPTGEIDGFYECPDLFPLAIDGKAVTAFDPTKVKWVLTAADSKYVLGSFDGKTFTPETEKLPGHRGKGFYAAQTFNDVPAADGRRIQIGWLQAPSPGMAFNQAMTVPLELSLRTTPAGPRLAWAPARELAPLRSASRTLGPAEVKAGDAGLADAGGELLDVRLDVEFASGGGSGAGGATVTPAEVALDVRGIAVRYHAGRQELSVNGHVAPAPLIDGRLRLTVLVDRTAVEVFAADGLTYVPFPVIPKPADRAVRLTATAGAVKVRSLEVHELRSAWEKAAGE